MNEFPKKDLYGDHYRIEVVSSDESDEITLRINKMIQTGSTRLLRTQHAMEQAYQRRISWPDVQYVLETGRHMQTRFYQKRPNSPRLAFEGVTSDQDRSLRIIFVEEIDLVVVTVIGLEEE